MTTLADCVVSGAQRVISRCLVYLSGEQVAELSVAGGSVTADSRRSILRDAAVDVAPSTDVTLADAWSLLTTPGVELALSRGFVLADGTELLAGLGRFVPDEPVLRRTSAGEQLSVSCSDVAIRIQRARWSDPYVIATGTALSSALGELLTDRYPPVRYTLNTETCPETLGVQVVTEAGDSSDPWADARAIAAAYGYDLYPDTDGIVTVRAVPEPTIGGEVFTFARGATAVVTEYETSSPLERTYNGVIATGEGTGTDVPVRGEAWDANPASPTYYLGAFGRVPYFYSSPLLTTADQCESAAARILAGVIGRVERLSWRSVVHPGLQPLDVVGVEQADGSVRSYVLDSVSIPLGVADAMSATTREVVVSY